MSFENPLTAQSITLLNEGEPYIEPSASSAPTDYDFLLGRHSVRHKKLKERFNNCNEWIDIDGSKNTEAILAGIGNESTSKGAVKKSSDKRTLVAPNGDKRYIKRDEKGQIKESDDQGKSLSQDVKKSAKTKVTPGYGDQGDQPIKKSARSKISATKKK
jgi:hypothetical protein